MILSFSQYFRSACYFIFIASMYTFFGAEMTGVVEKVISKSKAVHFGLTGKERTLSSTVLRKDSKRAMVGEGGCIRVFCII